MRPKALRDYDETLAQYSFEFISHGRHNRLTRLLTDGALRASLHTLRLDGSDATELHVSHCQNLRKLSVAYTTLGSEQYKSIHNLRPSTLDVRDTNFNFGITERDRDLNDIAIFEDEKVTGANFRNPSQSVKNMRFDLLVTLNFSGCKNLSKVGLDYVGARLRALVSLDLSYCDLQDNDLAKMFRGNTVISLFQGFMADEFTGDQLTSNAVEAHRFGFPLKVTYKKGQAPEPTLIPVEQKTEVKFDLQETMVGGKRVQVLRRRLRQDRQQQHEEDMTKVQSLEYIPFTIFGAGANSCAQMASLRTLNLSGNPLLTGTCIKELWSQTDDAASEATFEAVLKTMMDELEDVKSDWQALLPAGEYPYSLDNQRAIWTYGAQKSKFGYAQPQLRSVLLRGCTAFTMEDYLQARGVHLDTDTVTPEPVMNIKKHILKERGDVVRDVDEARLKTVKKWLAHGDLVNDDALKKEAQRFVEDKQRDLLSYSVDFRNRLRDALSAENLTMKQVKEVQRTGTTAEERLRAREERRAAAKAKFERSQRLSDKPRRQIVLEEEEEEEKLPRSEEAKLPGLENPGNEFTMEDLSVPLILPTELLPFAEPVDARESRLAGLEKVLKVSKKRRRRADTTTDTTAVVVATPPRHYEFDESSAQFYSVAGDQRTRVEDMVAEADASESARLFVKSYPNPEALRVAGKAIWKIVAHSARPVLDLGEEAATVIFCFGLPVNNYAHSLTHINPH